MLGQVAASEVTLRCNKSMIAVGPLRTFHPLIVGHHRLFGGCDVQFFLDVSKFGVDILDAPVSWTMPGGHLVCYSVRKLVRLKFDELQGQLDGRMYKEFATATVPPSEAYNLTCI